TLMVTAPNCACPFIDTPTNPNNPSICFGATTPALSVVLSGPPALGDAVNWYANATGGTALASGLNYTPTDTTIGVYTYYAEAEETVSGCVSSRIPVVLTIETPANAGTDGGITICD
ncbi:immunoglobulin domain-containing protein, partial [Pontimicrobium sp. MEBiC06410]